MFSTREIRIVIADDHALFRTGVKSVFQNLKNECFTIVGEATNGKEVVEVVKSQLPDIVLMDVEMPGINGIEATTIIKQDYPSVRTIGLSYSNASSTVLGMISAGADGYLLKDAGLEELVSAIHTVHTGVPYFSQATTIHMATKIKKSAAGESEAEKINLTKREREILHHIYRGESSKEIAAALFVSKRTIDTYRDKMLKKVGAKNVLQLLVYAIKTNIIQDLLMLAVFLNGIDL